jgi:hypothetical protein
MIFTLPDGRGRQLLFDKIRHFASDGFCQSPLFAPAFAPPPHARILEISLFGIAKAVCESPE